MPRRLVVNADDFGFTRDVNAGIIEAYERGILTATTLMADGDAFADAVRLAGEHPGLDVGVHLTLVGMPGLPASLAGCTTAVYSGQLDVYEIFAGQVRKVLAAGIRPTHVDTHKHTHLLPPVLRAVCTVAEEFGIGWVRSPGDFPFSYGRKGLVSRVMRWRRRAMRRTIAEAGLRTTDAFTGFAWTGTFTEKDLGRLLPALPEGVTEFMCHPGRLGGELAGANTRLKASRMQELRALTHPATRAAVEAAGIQLAGYREL
ncbi:MAG: ChbG/HpnK family deacetylase [Acidobacteria bacterium]|nr:ChbG/HpnK family deacetylase [Acidobacteriota bacterium]